MIKNNLNKKTKVQYISLAVVVLISLLLYLITYPDIPVEELKLKYAGETAFIGNQPVWMIFMFPVSTIPNQPIQI